MTRPKDYYDPKLKPWEISSLNAVIANPSIAWEEIQRLRKALETLVPRVGLIERPPSSHQSYPAEHE